MPSQSMWAVSTVLQQQLHYPGAAGFACPVQVPRSKLHQATLPGLNFCSKEESTSPFKAPSPFQSDWRCPVLTIFFFFLFFSSQPPRLIPASCRNFFRRLQPMSSGLTPMVRKIKDFLMLSELSCWWSPVHGHGPWQLLLSGSKY